MKIIIVILLAICFMNLTADLNEGLVAHYPFNGNANDESGNGNNGTVNGATLTNDRFGYENSAFYFDGIDDYISLGDYDYPNNLPFSLSMWISIEPDDMLAQIYSKYIDGSANGFFVSKNSNTLLRSYYSSASIFYNHNILNTYMHIVVIVSSTFMKMYVNGELISELTYTNVQSTSTAINYLGCGFDYENGFHHFFKGKIDDVRIYDRILNEEEISELDFDIVDFSATPTSGYLPNFEVNFIDESFGNPISWQWDFQNDGIYDSFEQNPTFIYTQTGIYDVKLKISTDTLIDSLIKQDYITVTYCPPVAPENVEVIVAYPDANISWTAVDSTECGSSITPDGYIVTYSEDEVDYLFLNYTTELSYIHTFVAQFRPQMFYQIIAYKDYTRAQIEYLESLNNSQKIIKWSDVKQNVNKIRK